MDVKKEYIQKIKKYLEIIRLKKKRKDTLQKEINLLKKRQKTESDLDLRELQIKSSPGTWDIGDLIVSCETKILMREMDIKRIDDDLEEYNLKLNDLEDDIDKKIIELRYFKKPTPTFEEMADELNYSANSISDRHKKALELLTYIKYGDIALEV